jgi:hypothetical protein
VIIWLRNVHCGCIFIPEQILQGSLRIRLIE